MFDGKAFGLEIVGAVKAHVADVLAPILARMDAMEAKLAMPVVGDDLSSIRSDLENLKKEIGNVSRPIAAEPLPDIPALVAEAVAKLPAPLDGKSVTLDDMRPLVKAEVAEAVASMPQARDGEPGKDGKDGVGLAGAVINREGDLVVTLTNGEAKTLGPIVGKDGADGLPGTDGLGLDDMDEEVADDGRTVIRRYRRGDQVKEFRHTFPVVIDRGVYRDGGSYKTGDAVTWAGSLWIAQKDTSGKPDAGEDWRLSVKRGRDGKSVT
jgi:hypothetical protein